VVRARRGRRLSRMSVGLTLNGGTLVAQNRDERRDNTNNTCLGYKIPSPTGLCRSELQREGLPVLQTGLRVPFGRSTEYGSRNLIAAAMGGEEARGGYFADGTLTV
jgi:hypothetical protein